MNDDTEEKKSAEEGKRAKIWDVFYKLCKKELTKLTDAQQGDWLDLIVMIVNELLANSSITLNDILQENSKHKLTRAICIVCIPNEPDANAAGKFTLTTLIEQDVPTAKIWDVLYQLFKDEFDSTLLSAKEKADWLEAVEKSVSILLGDGDLDDMLYTGKSIHKLNRDTCIACAPKSIYAKVTRAPGNTLLTIFTKLDTASSSKPIGPATSVNVDTSNKAATPAAKSNAEGNASSTANTQPNTITENFNLSTLLTWLTRATPAKASKAPTEENSNEASNPSMANATATNFHLVSWLFRALTLFSKLIPKRTPASESSAEQAAVAMPNKRDIRSEEVMKLMMSVSNRVKEDLRDLNEKHESYKQDAKNWRVFLKGISDEESSTSDEDKQHRILALLDNLEVHVTKLINPMKTGISASDLLQNVKIAELKEQLTENGRVIATSTTKHNGILNALEQICKNLEAVFSKNIFSQHKERASSFLGEEDVDISAYASNTSIIEIANKFNKYATELQQAQQPDNSINIFQLMQNINDILNDPKVEATIRLMEACNNLVKIYLALKTYMEYEAEKSKPNKSDAHLGNIVIQNLEKVILRIKKAIVVELTATKEDNTNETSAETEDSNRYRSPPATEDEGKQKEQKERERKHIKEVIAGADQSFDAFQKQLPSDLKQLRSTYVPRFVPAAADYPQVTAALSALDKELSEGWAKTNSIPGNDGEYKTATDALKRLEQCLIALRDASQADKDIRARAVKLIALVEGTSSRISNPTTQHFSEFFAFIATALPGAAPSARNTAPIPEVSAPVVPPRNGIVLKE